MYIITVKGEENNGAYSVGNAEGEQILYLYEEEDDAIRFAIQLEEDSYPEMHVIEVDEELMLKTCDLHDYKYTVITKNDIVIPPLKENDFSRENFSYGIGVNNGRYFFDLAYILSQGKNQDLLYGIQEANPIVLVNTNHNLIFTLGFRY